MIELILAIIGGWFLASLAFVAIFVALFRGRELAE